MSAAETGRLPDSLIRHGIRRLLRERLRHELRGGIEAQQQRLQGLVDELRSSPVALVPDVANEQHYEVPADFFRLSLGPRLKYSCCYWLEGVDALADAETAALEQTCAHAGLADGMDILELGCGWGSLSLWMAESFPGSQITAVSNSTPQREFIERRAAELGVQNLNVVTADMNEFSTDRRFDRVVSVEMFEHMRNYEELLRRIRGWMRSDARLFVHIFCHRSAAYPFEDRGSNDWMARHFFTGGIMPSAHLLANFCQDLSVERQWHWSGQHYERTSNAWLAEMDANRDAILSAFQPVYGDDAARWFGRWRIFHMACAELFGFHDGDEWFVTHQLLRPVKD